MAMTEVLMNLRTMAFLTSVMILLPLANSLAGMESATDQDLAQIQASTGISVYISSEITAGFLRYENADNNTYLEYQNVSLDDGAGGPWQTNGDILIDAGSAGGRSCLVMTLPDTLSSGNGAYWAAQSIDFNGHDAGSLAIENLRHSQTKYMIGSRTDGTTGVDLRLETNWDVDKIEYEIGGDEFALNGIYLSRLTNKNSHDPAVGFGNAIIGSGTWAHLDVGSDASGSYMVLDIPLQGSLRIGNVTLAGQSYGLTLLDNIYGTVQVRTPAGATWQY